MTLLVDRKYNLPLVIGIFVAITLLSSCRTTKYLDEGQNLLKENKVEFVDKSQISKELGVKSTIQSIIKQKPNTRYLGLKREWLNIKSQQRKEGAWFNKWMSTHGEPLAVYDSSLVVQSLSSIQNFLFNRGYFNAEVYHDEEIKKKKVTSIYTIKTGKAYRIDSLYYVTKDQSIRPLLDSLERTSLLKKGMIIEDRQYQSEKSRIVNVFLNKGYADFFGNFVSPLSLDTTNGRNRLKLEIFIPPGQEAHNKVKIGTIDVYSEYDPNQPDSLLYKDTLSDIVFKYYGRRPYVRTGVLEDKIFLRPTSLARKVDYENTYRGLGALGVYKFISITPQRDSTNNRIVNYDILLTPNKRWVWDAGIDLNYSTIRAENFGRNLFGVTGSASLENRNLMNRGISLALETEIGAEINISSFNTINTLTSTLNATMKIPKFTEFNGTLTFLSMINLGKRNLINKIFYSNLKELSSSEIKLQYQNIFVRDFYQYQSANLTFGYNLPVNKRKQYNINTFGISYYRPDTLARFDEITRNAEFVRRSFTGDRLFTGFLFRDLSFFYRSKLKNDGTYWLFNASTEFSGLEVLVLNNVYNAVTNRQGKFKFKLDKEIDFARFTKFEFQYRWFKPLPKNRMIAFRFNPAYAWSLDTIPVPYIKQYFVGGPQSIRAWQIRELGPGGDPVSQNLDAGQPFFSTGDFKLEFNLEFRFDLFWRLKSAFFVDVANVWLIGSDRPAANLSWDFYKQLAVGTGVGLRLDLTFVLFRLDLGYKIRNPFPDKNGSYLFYNDSNKFELNNLVKDINFNLAIGYPF